MQKTLLGLAVATALSSTAVANTDNSWLALDQEISNLSTTVVDNHGVEVSGILRTLYVNQSDNDTGGWDFNDIRINFKAQVEDVSVKVSTDLASGTAVLKDAYARWSVADGIDLTIGQFKNPFLYSVSVSAGSQLFLNRTFNATAYSGLNSVASSRDKGVMASGAIGEMGTWAVGVFNGGDLDLPGTGPGDEHRLTGRVAFDVVGGSAFGKHEGGVDFYGSDETHVSVAVGYDDDEDTGSDTRMAVEAAASMANIWLHLDWVDWDLADQAPMGITASYMVQEDVEVAIRFEDVDDADDTTFMTVGANYYMALPHAVKWSLNYLDSSSDDPAFDTDAIALGLTINF